MALTKISGDVIQTPLNVGVVTATGINVGSAVTIHTGGFQVGTSDLHSTGITVKNVNSTGVVTATSFSGNIIGNINSTGVSTFSTIKVGTAVTISGGIVTATSFSGDGSNLTNTGSTLSAASGSQRVVLTGQTSGTMTSSATSASLTFNASSGALSATSFSGSGANLTGIAVTENVRTNSLVVSGVSTFNNYVGINTTSASTFLHLLGNDISSRGQLSVTGDNSNNARISLYTNNTFIGHLQGGTTDGIKINTESTYPIIFSPGGNERVRVGSAGSLSVNTSTPQANLHVNGSGSLQSSILTRTGYASNNAEIAGYFVTNQGYNGSDGVNARVGVYGYAVSFNEGGAYGVYGVGYGNVGNGGGVGVYGISGSTYGSGGASYGVRGYRTRSPSTGNGYAGYFETESSLYSTNVALGIQVNAKTSGDGDSIGAVFNDNNSGTLLACSFRRSGTQVGRIETTASATAYQTSSDYRLKENIVSLTGAIDRLKNIHVRRFNFKVEPEKTVDGFIAHEVQPFVPEAVSGVKDEVKNIYNNDGEIIDVEPVYQGIDQAKLVPLLTAALQEALDKIDALQARLDAAGL